MNRINPRAAIVLAALLLAPAVLLAAGGSSVPPPSDDVPQMSPEQKARAAYEAGLKYRDNAWEYEEEAAAESGDKAEKKLAKARKAFKKAAGQFRRAVDQVPNFHQGWSSLGYALRRLGDYEESLAAYDRALQLVPQYPEAIEYRGEAYLGLDRIEEAKGAYMQLFQIDRNRADELMVAMRRWLERRRADAGGVPEETIEGFAAWIEEREELVAQVGRLASAGRSW